MRKVLESVKPTILVFRDEPERAHLEAEVLATFFEGGRRIFVLDRTIFYPEGGGQPGDRGSIGGVRVFDVQEDEGRVLHILEDGPIHTLQPAPGDYQPQELSPGDPQPQELSPGDHVLCILDSERRWDFSVQHSAQHLLSATIIAQGGGQTVSMHLGEGLCTIDVQMPVPDPAWIEALELEVNRLIREDLPLLAHVCPPEDASAFPLRKAPPAGESQLRIVEIQDYDYSPCCGTHVPSTGRLGLLSLVQVVKYKGMTRLSFVAGERGRRFLAERARCLEDGAARLGVRVEEVPDRVRSILERLRVAEARVLTQTKQIAQYRASSERDAWIIRGGTWHIVQLEADGPTSGSDYARDLSLALAALRVPALVVSKLEFTICAALPASSRPAAETPGNTSGRKTVGANVEATEAGFDMGTLYELKALAKAHGGKGGGSGATFRASFSDTASLEGFLALVGRERGAE